jgi:hypothetical protein
VSVSAARRDHRSLCQYDVVNPIEHRTNLANAGTVHDGRFPHADEVVWRQLLFQVCHGFPQLPLQGALRQNGFRVEGAPETIGAPLVRGASLLACFAVVALLLMSIGVYGVAS